jgi:hypothetical protein
MKEKLEAAGWKCHPCSCPGAKGFDCAHSSFKGNVIQLRGTRFRIVRKSVVIESAFAYELEDKLLYHDLLNQPK